MVKSNRGGKRVAAATGASFGGGGGTASFASMQQAGAAAQQQQAQQQPQQQTIPPVTPPQSISATYNQFMTMTDDQKADVISKTISQGVPVHLSDNDFQKFIYNMGLNDKPDVVDDATFNKMAGTQMWRTVNKVYDKDNDISFSAPQIAKQIQGGSITRVSDSGGSLYGRGLYFADSRSGSVAYGKWPGDVKKSAVITAKLNSNAKVINYNAAMAGANREIKSGSKLGKVLKRVDSDSLPSIYAMSKGYNVIHNGWDYYNVLNRTAVTISKKITAV